MYNVNRHRALNCLVFFEKIAFFAFWRQTDEQTNRWTAAKHLSRSRCRERRLNKRGITPLKLTIDEHKASRGLSAKADLLVTSATAEIMRLMWFVCLCTRLSFCLCAGIYWTAGQRIDPSSNSTFVWRTSNTYTTVSGMTYTNWLSNEPNYGNQRESCMQLIGGLSYRWNDVPCSSLFYSVCELDIRQ